MRWPGRYTWNPALILSGSVSSLCYLPLPCCCSSWPLQACCALSSLTGPGDGQGWVMQRRRHHLAPRILQVIQLARLCDADGL